MISTRRVLGHSPVCALIRSHRSLIRSLRIDRLVRAGRHAHLFAHSLAREFMGKRVMYMNRTRRYHIVSNHSASFPFAFPFLSPSQSWSTSYSPCLTCHIQRYLTLVCRFDSQVVFYLFLFIWLAPFVFPFCHLFLMSLVSTLAVVPSLCPCHHHQTACGKMHNAQCTLRSIVLFHSFPPLIFCIFFSFFEQQPVRL